MDHDVVVSSWTASPDCLHYVPPGPEYSCRCLPGRIRNQNRNPSRYSRIPCQGNHLVLLCRLHLHAPDEVYTRSATTRPVENGFLPNIQLDEEEGTCGRSDSNRCRALAVRSIPGNAIIPALQNIVDIGNRRSAATPIATIGLCKNPVFSAIAEGNRFVTKRISGSNTDY